MSRSVSYDHPITRIYWSDADSGYIIKAPNSNDKSNSRKDNDRHKFRLANVDAPETGGVGAAIGGAKCGQERARGFAAKAYMVELTRDKDLSIGAEYGVDKYDRLVIDLLAGGEDVGQLGIQAGYLKAWPHKGARALSRKPKWCAP